MDNAFDDMDAFIFPSPGEQLLPYNLQTVPELGHLDDPLMLAYNSGMYLARELFV